MEEAREVRAEISLDLRVPNVPYSFEGSTEPFQNPLAAGTHPTISAMADSTNLRCVSSLDRKEPLRDRDSGSLAVITWS